jgi:hypothetical protein
MPTPTTIAETRGHAIPVAEAEAAAALGSGGKAGLLN